MWLVFCFRGLEVWAMPRKKKVAFVLAVSQAAGGEAPPHHQQSGGRTCKEEELISHSVGSSVKRD
jgi:hypothetical protein